MTGTHTFLPKRTPGLVFHGALILLILGGAGFLLFLAFGQTGGINLILFLTGALILLAMLPLLAYRGYALLHAHYDLERDGIRIRWGLRKLDIPLSEVEWVRPIEDLLIPLKLPALSMPGAILGRGDHPDLGKVEFIASSADELVIVAAMDQVVILSPDEKEEFIQRFNRTIEMGTLTPIKPLSNQPAVFLRNIFADRLARVTIPLGFGLWFLLLVFVSIVIPLRTDDRIRIRCRRCSPRTSGCITDVDSPDYWHFLVCFQSHRRGILFPKRRIQAGIPIDVGRWRTDPLTTFDRLLDCDYLNLYGFSSPANYLWFPGCRADRFPGVQACHAFAERRPCGFWAWNHRFRVGRVTLGDRLDGVFPYIKRLIAVAAKA